MEWIARVGKERKWILAQIRRREKEMVNRENKWKWIKKAEGN